MIDFDSLLYGPVYDVLSVTATITPVGTIGAVDVSVIDKTAGLELQQPGAEVATVHPAAVVRASVLDAAGLTRAELRRATLTMNSRSYRIESTVQRPSPSGAGDGEVYLILDEN